MALIELKREATDREVRQFACLVLPALCALGAGWAIVSRESWAGGLVALAVGAMFGVLGWFRPAWFRPLYFAWMWAAFPLGWLVSHVMLGAIYFLVITPIGWLMRMAGRNPLALGFDPAAKTYWTPRATEEDPARYLRQS
jgi:hypothetical protein